MIKYENRIKMNEIRRLVEENQYIQAVNIVDTLELTKMKSLTDLSIIADVLIQNERFDDALYVLSKVYAKSKTRRILYQLVDLSIISKNVEEAEKYLLQYMKTAPQDSYRFIFRYRIDKLKNEPYEVLIESLEELKEYDYIEKWAYELAKLYHKAGKKDKCVRECSDIILWFGDGIYVEKAKLLKGYYVGEIDPIRMLKATEKREAEKRLGLDKTKDYSTLKNEIDKFIADDENGQDENRQGKNRQEGTKEAEVSGELIDKDKVTEPYAIEKMQEKIEDIHELMEGEMHEKTKETHAITEEINVTSEEVSAISGKLQELTETYAVEETQQVEKVNTSDISKETDIPSDTVEENLFEGKTEAIFDEKLDRIFSRTNLDYHELFGYFIHNGVCRKEIGNFLDNVLTDNGKQLHLVICGSKKSGKTTLAKEIAKALYGFDRLQSSKIAKISAPKINNINLDNNYDKLADCTLLIEEAGSLNNNGIEQLLRLMWYLEGHIFVILEETSDGMNKLLSSNEDMEERFQYRINLPSLTRDDLFHYANYYIKENDYQLTHEAEALLKNIIYKIMNSEKAEARLEAIMKVVKEAKLQAENRNKEELVRIIGSQEFGETDFLYINATDFKSV